MNVKEQEYYDSLRKCNIPEYSNLFANEKERYKSALACALEIRKFEIEMYWKRAQYFWTFISVIYGAYFFVLKDLKEFSGAPLLLMVIAILFSSSWYCVIRGSKFWQHNWERQVALLEDIVHGPVYKTVIFERNKCWRDLLSPFPYSVSKINQLLSLTMIIISIGLAFRELIRFFSININVDNLLIGILSLYTICFVIFLFSSETKSDDLGLEFYNKYNSLTRKKNNMIIRRIGIEE